MFSLFLQQFHECFPLVGHAVIEHGILEALFQCANLDAGGQMEHFHDFVAVDARLQKPFIVFLFQVSQLLAHDAEILPELCLSLTVLTGDVGFAKRHEVVDVVARIVQQASHGTVGHTIVGNGDGTHVQVNQFLHIFHLCIHRQL